MGNKHLQLETKFRIGDRVWIVYEFEGEVHVYSDTINSIVLTKSLRDGEEGKEVLEFWFDISDVDGTREEDLIPYEDSEGLYEKIAEIDKRIQLQEEANK